MPVRKQTNCFIGGKQVRIMVNLIEGCFLLQSV